MAGFSKTTHVEGIRGIISLDNSSDILLLADQLFIGKAINITNYAIIYVTIKSNVSSAEDGLSIQESSNGINWDHIDEYTINAESGKTFSFQAGAKFFRVVYTSTSQLFCKYRLYRRTYYNRQYTAIK